MFSKGFTMNKPTRSLHLALFLGSLPLLFLAPTLAEQNEVIALPGENPVVQDVVKPSPKIEFDGDQEKVYRAVKHGYIRPFSELYAIVEKDLYGRIIKVELEEDNNEWVYELKILFDNSVLKVEYDAATLEMLEVKGRNFNKALKPQSHQ